MEFPRNIQSNHFTSSAEPRPSQTPLASLPSNTPEESRRVQEIVKRVVEEHRETLEKLADE